MQEYGTKAGGAYSETVTGTDNYTLIDNGNLGTTKYTRTIDGSGTYNRTDTGPGATLPTDSGTISYHWDQTGDFRSGTFNLTQTGADRYDLLEDFHDVSNTQAGQTPGHMNIYPFGQTFVDLTFSVGIGGDISLFEGHYSGSVDINIGWSPNNGWSMGGSVTGGVGDGLGLGAQVGLQTTVTTADSVADLAGPSEQAGVWSAVGPAGLGLAALWNRPAYSGITYSGPFGFPSSFGLGGGVFHDRTQTLMLQLL